MLVFDCEAQMFYHSDIMKRSLRFVNLSINLMLRLTGLV